MKITRGILQAFNASTYTATVLLFEATATALTNVPVANHVDGTSALTGALCAVLFFDEHNTQDAVVIAMFNGSMGTYPTPAAGRLTFVSGYRQVNGDSIAANTVKTYTLSGGGSGIPAGALGVVYKAYFSSATVGTFVQLAPHAASDISAYASIGNLTVASSSLNGTGLLPIDAAGRIDIKANNGTCVVTLYTYGYLF